MSEERLERIEAGVQDLETGLQEVKADVNHLKVDVHDLKADVHVLKVDVGRLDAKVHNLTILHEDLQEKVRWIAERLDATATREEMSRGFEKMDARFAGLEMIMNTFIREQSEANRAFKEQFGPRRG